MKTDLKKILSISGEKGLFVHLAQGKSGIIVESLETKARKSFGISSKITSLADISIYTDEEDVALQQVFEKMSAQLNGEAAPNQKSDPKVLKAFFDKALPTYDRDRFYTSHMKKVVEWYNILREFASLDFVDEESEELNQEENTQE